MCRSEAADRGIVHRRLSPRATTAPVNAHWFLANPHCDSLYAADHVLAALLREGVRERSVDWDILACDKRSGSVEGYVGKPSGQLLGVKLTSFCGFIPGRCRRFPENGRSTSCPLRSGTSCTSYHYRTSMDHCGRGLRPLPAVYDEAVYPEVPCVPFLTVAPR